MGSVTCTARTRASAGAGEAVVVAAPLGGLLGGLLRGLLGLFPLLFDLALEPDGLAVQLGRDVPVRLPVKLLGPAEQLVPLGLRPAPDAHPVILPRTGGGRRRRSPERETPPGRGSSCRRRGTSRPSAPARASRRARRRSARPARRAWRRRGSRCRRRQPPARRRSTAP